MRTKGNTWLAAGLGAVVFLGSSGAEAAAAGATALKAQKINGSVYVNVNDLNQALGTSGAYNETSRTYTLSANTVPQIVEKVSPSVVGIIGRPAAGDTSSAGNRYNLAHGTGVIIKSNGWIVTNAHVIEGLNEAVVVTSDGTTYSITERFSDPVSDLAVIKINANHLKPVVFADAATQLQVGEQVIAIGTPISFSLRNSATTGVVSGLNRAVNASYKLIQTDTAINPGNSGGPLVNLKGQVVGINTMKFSAVGIENMGFSIPADTVKYVINHYFKYGEVQRASLGVDLEESWSAIVGLPTEDPLTVKRVASIEAQQAHIAEGDEIYSINGKRMTSMIDINELMKSFLPGQTVTVLMQSDGDIVERKLKLSRGDSSTLEAEPVDKPTDKSDKPAK